MPRRTRHDRQRGNSLLLAMIVMSALATLGSLTVVSVQGSLKASTNDRSQAVAMYAAESGAAIAMQFLRRNYNKGGVFWSEYVRPNNDPPTPIAAEQLAAPGNPNPDNPFSADMNASFSVVILNNRDDPSFADPLAVPRNNDSDSRVIIQATGRGPQGSLAIVEWEVQRFAPVTVLPPGVPGPPPAAPVLQPPPVDFVGPNVPLILLGWHVVL